MTDNPGNASTGPDDGREDLLAVAVRHLDELTHRLHALVLGLPDSDPEIDLRSGRSRDARAGAAADQADRRA